MLDLDAIVRRLGGERSGFQVQAPGPGHSSKDRSMSVLFAEDGSFTVNSHSGDCWKACRDLVRSAMGGEHGLPPRQPARIALPHETKRNLHRARHLWACRKEPAGTVVQKYLESRGITSPIPASIGYLEPGSYAHPAMISAFGMPSEPEPGVMSFKEIRGIHLTFLRGDGSGKADIDKPKIFFGPSCSFPIVVAQPNDLLGLAVTEGVEDALTVHEATGLGVWAAGSAGRMAALATRMPNYIECVTICAHSDEAGQKGAYALADALANLNVEVLIHGVKQ